jgi:hypothetical protein
LENGFLVKYKRTFCWIEREYKVSRSGGPHRKPTRVSQSVDGQLGYGTK